MSITIPIPIPTRMLAFAILLSAVLPLASAGAASPGGDKGELFKCEDAAGAISIQSTACAKGSKQLWRRDASANQAPAASSFPAAPPSNTIRLSPTTATPAPAPAPPSAAAATPSTSSTPVADPCHEAQRFAAAARDKPWLALSEQQVRSLYGWVNEQCKPAPAPRD